MKRELKLGRRVSKSRSGKTKEVGESKEQEEERVK